MTTTPANPDAQRDPVVPVGPMDTRATLDALDGVEALLLELLDSITLSDWDTPTIVPGWRIRHVAAHLLDTACRKLAIVRDGSFSDGPASGSPDDLRDFINRVNAEGVRAYGRLSPRVLRTLMEPISAQLCAYHRSLDPMAPAAFAVSWAGESQSANWFDTARELTERWHHQAQIRLALDRLTPLMKRPLCHPVLDCFLRVLPHAFRETDARDGTIVAVEIDGPAGGDWALQRTNGRWLVAADRAVAWTTRVTIQDAMAWRLFTKGLAPADARAAIRVDGDEVLASPVLTAVAIVG